METTVGERLLRLESDCGLQRRYTTPAGRLEDLIVTLRRRSERRVVLLIDEYDKPITDALDTPVVAKANRDYLHKLHSVIKECDQHVRFSFLTGVSKLSNVSPFSSLNNLSDLTLASRYSSLCGYTEHHLDTVFAPELPGLDRDRSRVGLRYRLHLHPSPAVPDRQPHHPALRGQGTYPPSRPAFTTGSKSTLAYESPVTPATHETVRQRVPAHPAGLRSATAIRANLLANTTASGLPLPTVHSFPPTRPASYPLESRHARPAP